MKNIFVNTLTLNEKALPLRLFDLFDPPKELYVRGTDPRNFENIPTLAVVGSRKLDAYGKQVISRLLKPLAAQGVVIVSGLAYGADSEAHRITLEAGGTTVVVLPCGIESVYPASHHRLLREVLLSKGCVVSEYPETTTAMKHTFIARNRLIAGLADAVLVVQAAAKSGSLHTAQFALELARPVLAVPGSITSELSEGVHSLIKQGAFPVTSAEDILEVCGWHSLQPQITPQTATRPLSAEQQKIVDHIPSMGIALEQLMMTLHTSPPSEVLTQLTTLEIDGFIRQEGGRVYKT